MKGKTGKSSAMRGGGLARKGVGMALKGGGIARKGTGSDATPGGTVAKMAMGGSTMERKPISSNPKMTPIRGLPGKGRPAAPVSANIPLKPPMLSGNPNAGGKPPRPMKSGGSVKMTAGAGSGSGRLEKVAAHKAAKSVPATGLKKGGKVKDK